MLGHAGFSAILEEYGVSLSTLWRAMKRQAPNLGLGMGAGVEAGVAGVGLGDTGMGEAHAGPGPSTSAPGTSAQPRVEAAAGTLKFYMDLLQEHFTKKLTPKWAAKTVKHVYATVLPKVIEGQGKYASKKYR